MSAIRAERRGGRDEEDERPIRCPRGGFEIARLFHGQIGDDEAVHAGGGRVGDESIEPIGEDGVVVAHQQERLGETARAEARRDLEAATHGRSRFERRLGRVLDGGAVGERVGEGHAQLDEVGAGVGDRADDSLGSGEIGIAQRVIGHQRGAMFGAGRSEGGIYAG